MQRSLAWRHAILRSVPAFTIHGPSSLAVSSSRAMTSAQVPPKVDLNASGMKGAQYLKDPGKFIAGIETFMFDVDGVIWKGGKLLDGIPETLSLLRSLGKKLYFVTNNSTKSRRQLYHKFEKMGLNISEEEILASSFAAAGYLKSIGFPADKKVYVVGDTGILEELELAGVQYIGGPDDGKKTLDKEAAKDLDFDPNVGAVVAGFDVHINYYKLVYATLCLKKNPGCLFIATNLDSVANITETQQWPAGGCMVGAIKAAAEVQPTVVGKPSSFMMDYLANKFQMNKSQICMVGDRLDTDILFGQGGGCKTLLVLTGVTDLETLQSPENDVQPDFYTDRLSDLLAAKS